MDLEKCLPNNPSPDWKGAGRVAVRQWRREPEPWKAGKNCIRAIFTHEFFWRKTHGFFLLTNDAPSMALLV